MLRILAKWFIQAVTLLVITQFVPGFEVDGIYIALILAAVLALLNVTVKPLLLFISLPLNFFTFGLFTFVINAGLLWFAATFIDGFEISNFLAALFAAIILWIVSNLVHHLIKEPKK